RSIVVGLSVLRFALNDSVPSVEFPGASLLLVSVKANSSWFFCRLSFMSDEIYLPLHLASSRRTVRAFTLETTKKNRATTPSADFCSPVGFDHSNLSRESTTANRSPEVSSTAFRAQPPDLQPASLR